MYEHYDPLARVFVNRDEFLEWMEEACNRCGEKSVLLHVHGLGGIGKSTLLDHWRHTIQESIIVDFSRHIDIMDRLDILARGAVRFGLKLSRFDLLWAIRLRFVKGVEPARETGREWAIEAISNIPFIGVLGNIATTIKTIGQEVGPRLTRRMGTVGSWFQSRLGKDYVGKVLDILWRDPRHAQFLFFDALLEDFNNRKDADTPIRILMDHFEHVDDERKLWRYKERDISELELWYVFLSSLSNCVCVTASRTPLPPVMLQEATIELMELQPLDLVSCIDLMKKKGLQDEEIQAVIANVSGGNPFVLNSICDLAEIGNFVPMDIESLGTESLEEVRVRTWRRLFNEAEGLFEIIDRAGLLPFFNQEILGIIVPSLKTEHWDRITKLSFVTERGDEMYELHDLAVELIRSELGEKLPPLAMAVAEALETAATKQADLGLLGMSLSTKALADEEDAAKSLKKIIKEFDESNRFTDALTLLQSIRFESDFGKAVLERSRGLVFMQLNRVAEAEQSTREAISLFELLNEKTSEKHRIDVALALNDLAMLMRKTRRLEDAEKLYEQGLQIYRDLAEKEPNEYMKMVASAQVRRGNLFNETGRSSEAEDCYREALSVYRELAEKEPEIYLDYVAWSLNNLGIMLASLGRYAESESMLSEALTIYRGLVEQVPDKFTQFLAWTLNNIGTLFESTGRIPKAEQAYRESLENYRILANKIPERFELYVATCSYNLGSQLLVIGNSDEAETLLQESLSVCRKLSEAAPEVFIRYLPIPLNGLAALYRQTGRSIESEQTVNEALKILRELAEKTPRMFTSNIASALNNLGIILRINEKYSEAEEAFTEGMELFEGLLEESPDLVVKEFVIILTNYAIMKQKINQIDNAEQMCQRALTLIDQHTSKFVHELHRVRALNNMAIIVGDSERWSEVDTICRGALEIEEKSAKEMPELFQPLIPITLNTLSIALGELGRESEALEISEDSLKRFRVLFNQAPAIFGSHLISVLNNQGILLKKEEKLDEAEKILREAVSIGETLGSKDTQPFKSLLMKVLGNLIVLLTSLEKPKEVKVIKNRLSELGSQEIPTSDLWIVIEQEENILE